MQKRLIAALAVSCVLGLAACGGDDDEGNAGRFEGEEAKVATVIDRLGDSAREGDVKTICEELITPELQKSVREASRSSCAEEFEQNIVSEDTRFRVESVAVRGANATAVVTDQRDRRSNVALVKSGENWRIARIQ